MPTQDQVSSRVLDNTHDLEETRLEAIGFIFHGHPLPTEGNGKLPAIKAGTNLLHFARCPKIDKAADGETKIWFRSVRVAKTELDQVVGSNRWKWCKICEREVTQRILNEP